MIRKHYDTDGTNVQRILLEKLLLPPAKTGRNRIDKHRIIDAFLPVI